MAADCPPESFAGGKALLDQLRLEARTDSLGVDLAVAIGILIAEECSGDDMRVPLALASAISLAATRMRRRMLMVSSCAGSA